MADVQTLPDYPRGITFEHVWACLMEDRERLKETERILRESQKETAQIVKEVSEGLKKTKKRQEKDALEFNKRLGALTNLFGDVTEAMIAPKICEKFEEFGFIFPRANPNVRINDRVNNISFEVDILLENGDKAMLLEVKTKLTAERVNKNIEKLEKMRKYADLRGDKRIFLGAVAGIVVTDEVRAYALNQGFYFIEYSGENFYITPPNGKPKEW
ncbi:MAG: hypothetical protein FWG07_01885 [Treponema sp.]|nr:hypothetical protein [Treponema sp.]